MRSVLIIDDDVRLSGMLRQYFARHEIALTACYNGMEGIGAVGGRRHDLVLLDVMLPDIDGFEVLRRLRESSDVRIMLLTARGDAADRVRGLRLGADDYIAKPFDVEELVARIEAVLRRGTRKEGSNASFAGESRLQRGALVIDRKSRTALYGDHVLELTDIEFLLLEMFLRSPGVVLPREELAEQVLQRPFHPLDRSLDMSICRLRRKLKSSTPLVNPIRTIRSSGYMFSTAALHLTHSEVH
jgi:DNA-binding response OmpR family regulator